MLKRGFDIIAALVGILIFCPLLLLLAVLIKLDSPGPILYRQVRMGQNGNLFLIHKLRSMYIDSDRGSHITSDNNDPRITRIGKFIRMAHLDELVQFLDVLAGDMGIVGHRPELPEFIKYYPDKWQEVLKLRPGITGLASLKLAKWEYKTIEDSSNPVQTYIKIVLPKKLRLEQFYVRKHNLGFDLKIIFQTFIGLLK